MWAGYLVWLALGDHPERRAPDVLKAYTKAVESHVIDRVWEECQVDLAASFLRHTRQGDACAGPGIYDADMVIPRTGKKELRVRDVRIKRKFIRKKTKTD